MHQEKRPALPPAGAHKLLQGREILYSPLCETPLPPHKKQCEACSFVRYFAKQTLSVVLGLELVAKIRRSQILTPHIIGSFFFLWHWTKIMKGPREVNGIPHATSF